MKNSVQILTIALALLTGTIGMRNLVVSAAPAPAQGTVLANGIGDPQPPMNFAAQTVAKNGIGDPQPPVNRSVSATSWSILGDPAPPAQQ